jgi:hypothetical protein
VAVGGNLHAPVEPRAAGARSTRRGKRLACCLALGTASLVGCGGSEPPAAATGTKGEPATSAERDALAALDALRVGEVRVLGGVELRAEPQYSAASGATCRWVSLKAPSGPETRRLACRDQRTWFYAPDVLAPPDDGR